jgi:hypothetical protein
MRCIPVQVICKLCKCWGALIAVKRIFDVSELSTKNLSFVEHACVKIKCVTFSCMFQLFTWLLMLVSVFLILGNFNLPKVKWTVDEESCSMISLNVTSDLESDVIAGLFGCDLDQINERPNKNGTFLDLVYTNMAVEGAETPLLKLVRHHKAYEIEMQVCCCKFEAMKGGVKRYRFKLADCVTIVDEFDAVDWYSLFSDRGVDQFVDLSYEMVWSCFERHVLTRYSDKRADLIEV